MEEERILGKLSEFVAALVISARFKWPMLGGSEISQNTRTCSARLDRYGGVSVRMKCLERVPLLRRKTPRARNTRTNTFD